MSRTHSLLNKTKDPHLLFSCRESTSRFTQWHQPLSQQEPIVVAETTAFAEVNSAYLIPFDLVMQGVDTRLVAVFFGEIENGSSPFSCKGSAQARGCSSSSNAPSGWRVARTDSHPRRSSHA